MNYSRTETCRRLSTRSRLSLRFEFQDVLDFAIIVLLLPHSFLRDWLTSFTSIHLFVSLQYELLQFNNSWLQLHEQYRWSVCPLIRVIIIIITNTVNMFFYCIHCSLFQVPCHLPGRCVHREVVRQPRSRSEDVDLSDNPGEFLPDDCKALNRFRDSSNSFAERILLFPFKIFLFLKKFEFFILSNSYLSF